jgi:DNA-directed RNA polymerase subunit RPC12/RpoP
VKVCSEPGCPNLQAESRCLEHRRQQERARGTRQERGYDKAHDQLRAQYQERMDEGQVYDCWRCGQPVDRTNWTLGHCDDNRSRYHGPECPPCDYATSGRTACSHPSHG